MIDPTFVTAKIGKIDVSLRSLDLFESAVGIDVVDLVSRRKVGLFQSTVLVIHITVTVAQRGLVKTVQIDFVESKVVIDGRWIGKHRHVAVFVVSKADRTSIRTADPGCATHCIVSVRGDISSGIGYRFEKPLCIIGKAGLSMYWLSWRSVCPLVSYP